MHTWIAVLLLPLLTNTLASGQSRNFRVAISGDQLVPGDSLHLAATFSVGERELPPATFVVTILGDSNKVWQLRWPLLKGEAFGTIVIPEDFMPGRYNLLFAVQPRTLKWYGKVVYPEKVQSLYAFLASGTEAMPMELQVDNRQQFVVEDVLLIDQGILTIYNKKGKLAPSESGNQPAFASLESWLDSAFTPVVTSVKQIVINANTVQDVLVPEKVDKNALIPEDFSCFWPNYGLRLKASAFHGLEPLALYDSLYHPTALQAEGAEVLNLLQDTSLLQYNKIYNLLEAKISGLKLNTSGNILLLNPSVKDREGNIFHFFLDEDEANALLLDEHPGSFAAVVIEPNGKEGKITVLSTRYPFAPKWPYYKKFQLQGYTPAIYTLPAKPVL